MFYAIFKKGSKYFKNIQDFHICSKVKQSCSVSQIALSHTGTFCSLDQEFSSKLAAAGTSLKWFIDRPNVLTSASRFYWPKVNMSGSCENNILVSLHHMSPIYRYLHNFIITANYIVDPLAMSHRDRCENHSIGVDTNLLMFKMSRTYTRSLIYKSIINVFKQI